MRQGNGSEILGANDPRSANIGIIHVAPTDDRESVLAAILTQERLGRKQVAVVLPEQNKAFQHPIDFDGLKNMRRRLQAQILFVAPAGPGPAEFARQRRFPVYSSLEYFANSFQEDDAANQNQADKNGKAGRLFGRKQKSVEMVAVPAPSFPAQSAQAHPLSKTVLAPVNDELVPVADTEADEELFPMSSASNGSSGTGNAALMHGAMGMPPLADSTMLAGADDEEDEEDELDVPLPPIIPMSMADADAVSASSVAQSNGAGVGQASARSTMGPNIIELSPRRTANTGKLAAIPAAQADPQPINLTARPRNTGKIAAVGAVGAVGVAAGAGTAGMGAGAGPTTMTMAQTASTGGGGGGIPPRGNSGGGGSAGGPTRNNSAPRWLIAAALVILTLLVVFGGIAYAAPGVLKNLTNIVPGGASLSSSATVTITPTSKTIKNTYVITAVTGTPSASQRQVQSRILTYTTPAQTRTAKATGVKKTVGVAATGFLTFYNGSNLPFTVAASTVFATGSGIQLVNDIAANIPAGNLAAGIIGNVTVPAHAANIGASGNVSAGALNATCCATGGFISVKNLKAFSGGQDPQNYTFVQQSDIDGIVNPLEQQLTTTAQNNVKGQKKAGEQYINASNPVQCTPNVVSNQQAGDKASSVTSTVKVTCTAQVYDQQAAETMAVTLYKNDSTINPGPGFALSGNVTAHLTQATVVDSKGTVSLLVDAQGTWVYQITSAQEKAWAQHIKGMSKQAAQDYLQGQTGVSAVTIQLSSGNTLPTDPNQISFVINGSGSSNPTPGSSPVSPGGTPTATPTPVSGLGGR